MARTGRPKKKMLRRKNHEGTVYEKTVIKEKKAKGIPICDVCKKCDIPESQRVCNNRQNCKKCERCMNCKKFGKCEKITSYTYYEAQYIVGYTDKGKPIRKTITEKTETEVVEQLNQIKAHKQGFIDKDKSKKTLCDIATEKTKFDYDTGYIDDNSYKTNMDTIKRLKNYSFFTIPVRKVTRDMLKDFLTTQKVLSESIIKKNVQMVRRAFAKAHADNLIIENPFLIDKELKTPKSTIPVKEVEAFSVDDQKKLVKELMEDKITQKIPILLSLYTLMRSGEILALRKNDIDLKNKVIKVRRTMTRGTDGRGKIGNKTKTYASSRDVTISPDVEILINMALDEYVENPEQLIFCNKDGKPYTTQALNSCFKRFCEKHNIDKGYNVNFHQLRHTGITRLIEVGTPVEIVQKKAGHKDITTTMNIYNTVLSEREKEVNKNIERQFEEKGLSLSIKDKKE